MDLSIAGEQTDGCLPTRRTVGGRALWWVSALLLTGMIAIVLPIGQIKIRGAQLGGIIGSYGGGYYKVSYSGGSFTVSPSSSTDPVPFSAVASGSTYDYGASVSVTGNNPSIVSSAKSTPTPSTPIVVTCTWMPSYPGEAPPDSVILQENSFSQAEAQSYNGGTPQLSVDDGLGQGDAATPGSNSLKSEGTRYSVLSSPGASFTVQVTPIASASLTGSPMPAPASATPLTPLMGVARCIIGYSLKPTVPSIIISGTTPTYDAISKNVIEPNNVLIGQQLKVSVDTGGMNQIYWEWSIDGDPFNGFSMTQDCGIAAPRELSDKDAMQLNRANVSYFYRSVGAKGGVPQFDQTVKIRTVTCKVQIIGALIGPELPVTVKATVVVYQPTFNCVATHGTVRIDPLLDGNNAQVNRNDINGVGIPVWWFRAGSPVIEAGVDKAGVVWDGQITEPTDLLKKNPDGSYVHGAWDYVQVIKPNYWQTVDGQNYAFPENGDEGLDFGFPYGSLADCRDNCSSRGPRSQSINRR